MRSVVCRARPLLSDDNSLFSQALGAGVLD